jgi:hypothetical protein
MFSSPDYRNCYGTDSILFVLLLTVHGRATLLKIQFVFDVAICRLKAIRSTR